MPRKTRRKRTRSTAPKTPPHVEPIAAPRRVAPGMGEESVWDYPRPPAIEAVEGAVEVWFAGVRIASSVRAVRVCETAHPPAYYLPLEDCRVEHLDEVPQKRTVCEYKGRARYYDVVVGDRRSPEAAWRYARPRLHFDDLGDRVAFYPQRVDRCIVNGERVLPQAGDYYGGWVTGGLIGPFKGCAGTEGW